MTYPFPSKRKPKRFPTRAPEKWVELERHSFRARKGQWEKRRRYELK